MSIPWFILFFVLATPTVVWRCYIGQRSACLFSVSFSFIPDFFKTVLHQSLWNNQNTPFQKLICHVKLSFVKGSPLCNSQNRFFSAFETRSWFVICSFFLLPPSHNNRYDTRNVNIFVVHILAMYTECNDVDCSLWSMYPQYTVGGLGLAPFVFPPEVITKCPMMCM